MAGDKHTLPRFSEGKSVILKGKTLNKIMSLLESWRPLPGRNMKADVSPSGTLLHAGKADIHRNRFEIYVGGEARNELFVAPGSVLYNEVLPRKGPDDGTWGPRTRKGIIPTLDGTRLDAEEPPSFGLGTRDDGCVWLVCQLNACNSNGLPEETEEPERVVLTGRGAKPELQDGEFATELAYFDLAPSGNDALRLDNVQVIRESDLTMAYSCGDLDDDPSNDSGWGSDTDDSADPDPDPDPDSNDPSDNEDDNDGCKMTLVAKWENSVDCFPAAPVFTPADKCKAAGFTFQVRVTFKGLDPYNKKCPSFAYGVQALGSETPEEIWFDQSSRVIRFRFTNAPACGYITLAWRVRSYPREDSDRSCCGKIWSGALHTRRLPHVCGCACSSPGDIDGDGIPNAHDPDYDNDGDGIPNGSDPDWGG